MAGIDRGCSDQCERSSGVKTSPLPALSGRRQSAVNARTMTAAPQQSPDFGFPIILASLIDFPSRRQRCAIGLPGCRLLLTGKLNAIRQVGPIEKLPEGGRNAARERELAACFLERDE